MEFYDIPKLMENIYIAMKGVDKDVMMMFAKEDLRFYLEHKKTKKTKHKNTQHQF